jgi:YaiO family outer membrane protein
MFRENVLPKHCTSLLAVKSFNIYHSTFNIIRVTSYLFINLLSRFNFHSGKSFLLLTMESYFLYRTRFARNLLFIALGLVCAANNSFSQSADDLFKQARAMAFDKKNYNEAIRLSREALEISPVNHDIRIFQGRVFYWNSQPDSARQQLGIVLKQMPSNEDAASAIADIEYYSDQYKKSIQYCDSGLFFNPNSAELLYRKARALNALFDRKAALMLSDSILKKYPAHKETVELKKRIRQQGVRNSIGISYDHTHFNKQFKDDWKIVSVQYSRQTRAGSLTARVNYGHRYGEQGVQFEADAYPRISTTFYSYINFGYSPDMPVFPKFRGGLSLYANLPASFEAELGTRYLNFGDDTWIYTASLGKYHKNLWFNLRTYLTPNNDKISHSYTLSGRYYLSDADNYVSLAIGSGISPDDRAINAQLNSDYKLLSKKITAGYRFTIAANNIISVDATMAQVEYMPKTKDQQISIGVSYQRRF